MVDSSAVPLGTSGAALSFSAFLSSQLEKCYPVWFANQTPACTICVVPGLIAVELVLQPLPNVLLLQTAERNWPLCYLLKDNIFIGHR